MKRLCCMLILLLAGAYCAAQEPPVSLVRKGTLFYADMQLQDSLPVRVFLESGVQFPLIDLALARSHPGLFELEKLEHPVRFRMADGKLYAAGYKLASGLKLGPTRSLRETYAVDLEGMGFEVMYPLNLFTSDAAERPGIFLFDIRHGELDALSADDLPASRDGWTVLKMQQDGKSGMYLVTGRLRLADGKNRSRSLKVRFTLDLGNGNLLALFAYKPGVGRFVERAPAKLVSGTTPRGVEMRVLMPAVATFFELFPFPGSQIVLIDKPMELPGDGFLGNGFFEAFRVIFDFRHERLWLAPAR